MVAHISPPELQKLLEWAGAKFCALPAVGLRPARIKVIWPEYAQDRHEVLDFRGGIKVRAPIPSPEEITIMEQILVLPNVCEWVNSRRVLHLRSMVHPISGRYIYTWAKIARTLDSGPERVKAIHSRALREVITRTPTTTFAPILAFHSEAA